MNRASHAALRYGASITLLLLAWWVATAVGGMPKYILPTPGVVFELLAEQAHTFLQASLYTLRNAAIGALLGVAGGFITGTLLAYSGRARWITEPYLVVFQSFPREALAPLFVVWLGFGTSPKIALAALLCYFPMALVTLNSLTDTRSDYLELVRSWGANKRQEFWHCRLPASIPTLIGLQRVCLPLALVGAVLAEFMGGSHGLGYIIMSAGAVSRLDRVSAAVVVLGVIGTALLAIINLLQHTVLGRFGKE